MPVAAVITADIVNSTLPVPKPGKKLVTQLSAVLKSYLFEFYRGDSFQVYVKDASAALKLAFQLRTAVRKLSAVYDVRISIGIGKVTGVVKLLRTANSEAFVLSGRTFDLLKDDQRLCIQSADEKANTALRVIGAFSDYLVKKLTAKQAEVVFELLKEQSQTAVANKLKITQSTVNKHAQSAGWMEMEKMLREYDTVITQFNLL